jgi:hypothetical protein
MTHRIKIFKDVCWPSLVHQTNKNFKVIVLVNPATPPKFMKQIKSICSGCGKMIVPCSKRADILPAVRDTIHTDSKKKDFLITSRLDNDDGISSDFIEQIQNRFDKQKLEFVNFSHGYILNLNDKNKIGFYKSTQFSNPFISLIESSKNFRTVHCGEHDRLNKIGHILQIDDKPNWIQTVHGNNVTNSLKLSISYVNNLKDIKKRFHINYTIMKSVRDLIKLYNLINPTL